MKSGEGSAETKGVVVMSSSAMMMTTTTTRTAIPFHALAGSKLRKQLLSGRGPRSMGGAAEGAGIWQQTVPSCTTTTTTTTGTSSTFAKRQMEKMGWKVGMGLGKRSQGRTTHVIATPRIVEQAGLGTERATAERIAHSEQWWKDSMSQTLAKLAKNNNRSNSKRLSLTSSSKQYTDEELFAATGGARFGMRANPKSRSLAKWSRTQDTLLSSSVAPSQPATDPMTVESMDTTTNVITEEEEEEEEEEPLDGTSDVHDNVSPKLPDLQRHAKSKKRVRQDEVNDGDSEGKRRLLEKDKRKKEKKAKKKKKEKSGKRMKAESRPAKCDGPL